VRQSPLARFLLGVCTIFYSASLCPSRAQQPQQPPSQQAHSQQPAQSQHAPSQTPTPSSSSPASQAKKPPAPAPAAPQSTHYPILLLVQAPTQDNGNTWSLRIGLRGPERLDRTNYPPIPLEPAEVTREGNTDAWTYHAKDSQTGAAVSVHLTREPCSDPSSTAKFAFTATVEHAQIGSAQGCARIATELFPKINNQPTEEDDDAKDKPAPPTVTHFKAPTAVAYISASDKLIMKRGTVARAVPAKGGYQPDLSHDGKRLLYTTDEKADERAISLYDWTASKSSALLAGPVQQASWSPDDTRIAFRKFDGSKWQLWTMPWDAPEKATLAYPGEVTSLEGWVNEHTLLVDDLQNLSWIGDDGTVKQTVSDADLYGNQFRASSSNTVRVHPLNPDLLLVSAEMPPSASASQKNGAGAVKGSAKETGAQSGMAFFLYEVESKRRVLLSPTNLNCSLAEWSRDGLQIYFTGRESTGSSTTIYKMFWDGTSQLKVQDGHGLVIGQ
jgi:WD40-like Beta Propeller Repeat